MSCHLGERKKKIKKKNFFKDREKDTGVETTQWPEVSLVARNIGIN